MPDLRSLARQGAVVARSAAREVGSLVREGRLHRPQPPATGLVLDVGSGQRAHQRADVVVDKYVIDDFERAGGAALDLSRPLIVADAERLPFADLAFAYVIASHVLEHATDPVRFAAELSRVAGAGFVQVPSGDSERVYGWPFHPWFVDLDDAGVLRFSPKPPQTPPGGESMHAAFEESPLVRAGWLAHRSRWQHSVHWTGAVAVAVEGERVAHEQADFDAAGTIEALQSSGRAQVLPPAVRATLRCPACREALQDVADGLLCGGCALSYPVVGGVPVLVAEASSAP